MQKEKQTIKTKNKRLELFFGVIVITVLLAGTVLIGNLLIEGYTKLSSYVKGEDIAETLNFTRVSYARAEEPKELSREDWIKRELENNGISWEQGKNIIQEESSWREDICIIEPNFTISCGLWQLNTVHNKSKGLTNACKLDYKCATKFAIELYYDRGGSWSAWSTSKKLGYK